MEEESWGVLTKSQFDHFVKEFTKEFGKPVHSKRLSISFWDHQRNEIDTRIRITDGNAEIMQKIGDIGESKHRIRSEQKVNLHSNIEEVFNTYQILRNLIPGNDSCYIYQYDNYIFKQDNIEIKLTHQIGKSDKFNFEVEADSKRLNKTLIDFGLEKLVTVTNTEFWDKWNEELNLNDTDLNEEQIRNLIEKYLN